MKEESEKSITLTFLAQILLHQWSSVSFSEKSYYPITVILI